MDVPLGLTAGNALEVRESVEVLAGGGPADIVELTILLAQEMLELAGIKGADPAAALKKWKSDGCLAPDDFNTRWRSRCKASSCSREHSCHGSQQRNNSFYGCE